MEWIEFTLFGPGMLDQVHVYAQLRQAAQLDARNKSHRDDMLGLCLDAVHDFHKGGLIFCEQELDESERLINAQIITQGHLTICDYANIKLINAFIQMDRHKPVAFGAMVPIQLEEKHPGYRHHTRDAGWLSGLWPFGGQQQGEQQQNGQQEKNKRAYGTLLLQGLLLLCTDQKAGEVILTVDLTRVIAMYIDEGHFAMTLKDTEQSVRFEMVHMEHFNVWTASMERFIGEQLDPKLYIDPRPRRAQTTSQGTVEDGVVPREHAAGELISRQAQAQVQVSHERGGEAKENAEQQENVVPEQQFMEVPEAEIEEKNLEMDETDKA